MRPARVGLTGGIGSGKSTAAAMFAELGAPVLDLDEVGHRVTERPDVLRALAGAFGRDVLDGDGRLLRARLADRAFADSESVRRLNAIVHPHIWREEARWLAACRAPWALIEASALIESGGVARMDAVVVVMADRELRLRRALARGGRNRRQIEAIMARQCSDEERRRAADYLIDNNGSLDALRRGVARVHAALSARFPALDKGASRA